MSGYINQVKQDSPSFFWPLNDVSTSDIASGAYPITYSGSPTAAAGPGGIRGTTFNGSSQYGSTSNSFSMPAAGDISWEVWANKSSGTGLYSAITCASTGNPAPWGFDTYGAGGNNKWRAFMTSGNGGANYLEAPDSTTIVNGVWYHLVGSLSSTTLTLYVNGVAAGSDNTTSGLRDANGGTAFGLQVARYNASFSQYFPGTLAMAAMYPSALSATRVKVHYEAGLYSGLVSG